MFELLNLPGMYLILYSVNLTDFLFTKNEVSILIALLTITILCLLMTFIKRENKIMYFQSKIEFKFAFKVRALFLVTTLITIVSKLEETNMLKTIILTTLGVISILVNIFWLKIQNDYIKKNNIQ